MLLTLVVISALLCLSVTQMVFASSSIQDPDSSVMAITSYYDAHVVTQNPVRQVEITHAWALLTTWEEGQLGPDESNVMSSKLAYLPPQVSELYTFRS